MYNHLYKRVTILVFKNEFIDALNDFSIQKKKKAHAMLGKPFFLR